MRRTKSERPHLLADANRHGVGRSSANQPAPSTSPGDDDQLPQERRGVELRIALPAAVSGGVCVCFVACIVGYNRHGQLGLGDNVNRNTPKQIPDIKATSISTGYGYSLIIGSN